MEQKIIKIGSSIGVTLPAKEAQEEGIVAGQKVNVRRENGVFIIEKKTIRENKPANSELVAWAEEAVERYRPALEALKDK